MISSLLFVYGTLLRASSHPMARFLEERARFVGEARVRGLLYDMGPYPALLESQDPDDWVHGELFKMHDPGTTLIELDRYEGNDPTNPMPYVFVRQSAMIVAGDGQEQPGWVYFFVGETREEQRIHSGDYRPKLKR